MIQVICPQIDNGSLLDTIIANKKREQRDLLTNYKSRVKQRYRYYSDNIDALQNIQSLGAVWDPVRTALRNCYGANKAFIEAKKSLYAAMPVIIQNKCPYCMLNRPNTLDHYFDKNDYPEYSVYIPNLIPCCSECNTSKDTAVFDEHGYRKFIHFYYDSIPDYQFLFIRFQFIGNDNVPEIEIYLKFEENDIQEPLIRAHFDELGLLEKYRSAVNEKLAVIIAEQHYSTARGLSHEEIRITLESTYHALVNNYGANFWETCIYEGILNSPDFFQNIMIIYPMFAAKF